MCIIIPWRSVAKIIIIIGIVYRLDGYIIRTLLQPDDDKQRMEIDAVVLEDTIWNK